MKRISIVFSILLLAALACTFGAPGPQTPTEPAVATLAPVEPPPATELPAPATEAPAEPTAALSGQTYTCDRVRMIIPDGLAAGIECVAVPPQSGEEMAPWEVTPGHIEIGLAGYALGDKFHRPRLYIYPLIELVALQPYVAENVKEIQSMLANPGGPFKPSDLPGIHFFNAGAVFASNIAVTNFQAGSGVRAVTVFGQYYAPVNNTDLFYHFQGLSSNGQSYIIAILPITHPGLQANAQEGSLPASAQFPAYPGFSSADIEAEMGVYYDTTGALLNAAAPEAFNPTLTALDALIQSIEITP